jgi:tetratricopeptide (TPR) repeat protein
MFQIVGAAFQPRAPRRYGLHRGWKAAPTSKSNSLAIMSRTKKSTNMKPAPDEEKGISKVAANHLFYIAIPVLLGLVVYFNSLDNGFVYDDYATIVENKYIRQPGKSLPSLFNRSYFNIAAGEASYRPVATLSYYLIYAVGELNATWYHLFSVLLHAFNVMLAYILAHRIIKNRYCAMITGLLFACHPALTEAVDAISYNEDLLTAAFFLLSVICYAGINTAVVKSGIPTFVLSLVCFLLALLSKEMAITLPAVLFLYDLTIRDAGSRAISLRSIGRIIKERIYFYTGYLAVSFFYLYLRFVSFYNPGESIKPLYGSLIERIVYLPAHLFSFIKLAVFPAELNADYVFAYPAGFFEMDNLIGLLVVFALIVASFAIYKKSKPIFFGIWWFLITLSPVYNLIPLFNPLAERYLYIPILGFCMAAAVVVNDVVKSRLPRPGAGKIVTTVLVVFIVGLFSSVTIARNRDWKDGLTLWSKTVKSSPDSSVARGSLGHAYQQLGRLDEAVEQYKRAVAIYPDDYKAHYNLGVVYDQQGLSDKAIQSYQRSIQANPAYPNARFNLGIIYQNQGEIDQAIVQFRKVTELDPADFQARNNLGVAYAMQGELEKAVAQWEKILELDPENSGVRENIIKARQMMKP